MIHLYYCACHIPHRHLEKILLCASADTISQAFAYINRYIRRIHNVYFSGRNENVYLKIFLRRICFIPHIWPHFDFDFNSVSPRRASAVVLDVLQTNRVVLSHSPHNLLPQRRYLLTSIEPAQLLLSLPASLLLFVHYLVIFLFHLFIFRSFRLLFVSCF